MAKSLFHVFRGLSGCLYRWYIISKIAIIRAINLTEESTAVHGIQKALKQLLGAILKVLRFFSGIFVYVIMFICSVGTSLGKKLKINFHKDMQGLQPLFQYISGMYHHFQFGKRSRLKACSLMASATIMIFSASYFGVGVEVFINGQSMGFVTTRDEALEIIHNVELKTSEYLGHPYNLQSDVQYSLGYVQRDNMVNTQEMEQVLLEDISEISTQFVMLLDGQIVGANSSKTQLELLKQKILAEKTPDDNTMKSSFLQNITIEERMVANTYVKSVADIENALRSSNREIVPYHVQKGDTVSKIAENYGLTTQDVQNLNPEIEGESLAAGQQIRVAASVPLVSVRSTRTVSYTETLPYDVEVQYSDDMYKNESKIVQKGVSGQETITADVVYIDGVEVGREVVDRATTAQPVMEVKMMGTKELPVTAASGSFSWPFRGLITSRYGYRWGSEFHNALDIAGPSGSPVVAADGGTVIMAKYNGNLGNCVIIDHGNGYKTLYAHNSKLLVKQGQKVAKGERISLVGSTGRSTGPHLHFEVHKNNKNVNPLNYLP